MLTLQVIACIGIIKGAFLLFQIRLNDFTGNIFHRLLDAPKGIREEILEETKRRKKSYFRREIEEVQAILKTTDREELFPLLCTASLLLFAILLVLLGVMVYYKETRKAEELVREKREQIEGELYRFVSTITQELKNSRDVLSMLEHYKENAGEMFQKELDIVCADMRSSSYEAALTRFEARLNSPQLSDVVRGLIGVLRGDDGAVYFQMLTHDFKQAELQRLKAKAAKIPPKIRVFSFAMLLCFLATYFAIIGYEIIKSMGTLF